jgi:pimeloyl-ACP methyl ester carboxylesterase
VTSAGPVSTPTSLTLPDGVRPTEIATSRGAFAALEAKPPHGVCERETALLVPGYTGSKEDFISLLDQLAAAGRRIVAIDMRGQYQTPGNGCYSPSELAADIAAITVELEGCHLLGHSYGGLVTRDAVLDELCDIASFTLMSSGPAAVTGPRADELRTMLTALANQDVPAIWASYLEPQAVAAGLPAEVVAFLKERLLGNDPAALAAMAHNLLGAADRTAELAKVTDLAKLVLFGQNDNAWLPTVQEKMARELGARRVCIPGAAHSPNVEAPATTASALTTFWDQAEAAL